MFPSLQWCVHARTWSLGVERILQGNFKWSSHYIYIFRFFLLLSKDESEVKECAVMMSIDSFCQRFVSDVSNHYRLMQTLQKSWKSTRFQGCESFMWVWAGLCIFRHKSKLVPGVSTTLTWASVSWGSTYPTIPCCMSLKNELCFFHSLPQTSACCIISSKRPASTAARWYVRHARAQNPSENIPLSLCRFLSLCDNGPRCVIMGWCCLINLNLTLECGWT